MLLCNAVNSLDEESEPRDWSVCLRSRIGDETCDVIVVDYFELADPYLIELTHRIRLRFPDALIINLKHWHPIWTGYVDRKGWINVKEWLATASCEGD